MYRRQYIVRLTPFACWEVLFFVRVPRRQYVVARKGSLMKTQTRILDNRLYYTGKIELHRKGKKSPTVRITPILIRLWQRNLSVLITLRRVHYGEIGKAPTTDKYLNLARKLNYTNHDWCFWFNHQRIIKVTGNLEEGGLVETIQTTTLLRTAKILRRVLDI